MRLKLCKAQRNCFRHAMLVLSGCAVVGLQLAVCFQLAHAGVAGGRVRPPLTGHGASYLPEGFENVHLGMTFEELLATRGDKVSPLWGQYVDYPKMLDEIPSASAGGSSVVYGFADDAPILIGILFHDVYAVKEFDSALHGIFERLTGALGERYAVVAEVQGGKEYVVVSWRHGDLAVLLDYSPQPRRSSDGSNVILTRYFLFTDEEWEDLRSKLTSFPKTFKLEDEMERLRAGNKNEHGSQ